MNAKTTFTPDQQSIGVCPQAGELAQANAQGINGLTEAETNATASVMGLVKPEQHSIQHTPEPWFVRTHERMGEVRDCFVAAKDVQGLPYDAEILGDDEYREDDGIQRKLADARRIVACVNACRTIETDTLERHPLGVISADFGQRLHDITTKRDELAKALQAAIDLMLQEDFATLSLVPKLQAVISKTSTP